MSATRVHSGVTEPMSKTQVTTRNSLIELQTHTTITAQSQHRRDHLVPCTCEQKFFYETPETFMTNSNLDGDELVNGDWSNKTVQMW